LGASEIFLYFDRPDDPAAPLVAAVPGVDVICCDAPHWARLGWARPHKHQIRQARNANDAYRRTGADWLLHVDADEYLWAADPVEACLAPVAQTVPCAVVTVAERMALPGGSMFAGPFRRPFLGAADAGRDLFGPDFDLTFRGLTGHALGKSFVRAGQKIHMSIHRPKPKGADALEAQTVTGLGLLHFDGLTRLQWVYKLLRKADAVLNDNGMPPSPHRARQIAGVLLDPQAGFAMYDRVKQITPTLKAQLQALDLWCDVAFDPAPALAQIFPGCAVDLSSEAADAWLWAQQGDLLRRYGLRAEG
jgi:hypothetical protein